jgi:hypothetical protein
MTSTHPAGKYTYLLTLVSSTNKTDCQDITEILLNVVLNTINLNLVLMSKLLFQKRHNSVIETKSDYIRDYLFM